MRARARGGRGREGKGRDGGRCMKMGNAAVQKSFSNRHRGAFHFVFRSKLFKPSTVYVCLLILS